jgi:hypothetical protein
MKTKEEYYQSVLENRKLAADPEILKCPCTSTLCEWHGRCRECVALHRYQGDHVPACLQPLLRDKLQALAAVAEQFTVDKEKTPDEYREYVRERDQLKKARK